MSEEQEQFIEQQRVNLLDGLQVEASAEIGIDIDGQHFAAPLVQLHIDGSRIILQVDDEHRSDQWVRIIIAEELLARIVEAQSAAAAAEGDGEQPADDAGTLSIFDAAWDVLAEQGKCDERGSAEYRRVSEGWNSKAWMLAALQFIISQANEMPPENPTA